MRWVMCRKCKGFIAADSMAAESDRDTPSEWICKCEPEIETKNRAPMITPDIQPYKNMIDGTMITSRKEHKEFLKRNRVEVNPDPSPQLKEHLYKLKHTGAKDVRDPRPEHSDNVWK